MPPSSHRITNCPETGRSLVGVDIAAHIDNLWPKLDPRNSAHKEAIRRRDLLAREHNERIAAGEYHGTPLQLLGE